MFENFAGNEGITSALSDMAAKGHLPQAIIVEGEAGLGKRTFAAEIAKSAVCTGDIAPCNICHGCRLADRNMNPDITLVAPETRTISVDVIRHLRAEAFVMPNQSPRRVFVINDAAAMNEQAANALLKVLEEPPETVVFILVTESASSLLATIRSRCTIFSLTPPSSEAATEVVMRISGKDKEDILPAVQKASNNIGVALEILAGSGSNTDTVAQQFLGFIATGKTLEALKAVRPSFERDRLKTAQFLKEVKVAILSELKEKSSGRSGELSLSRSTLINMLETVEEWEQAAESNVNLPLLYASLCASLKGRL